MNKVSLLSGYVQDQLGLGGGGGGGPLEKGFGFGR